VLFVYSSQVNSIQRPLYRLHLPQKSNAALKIVTHIGHDPNSRLNATFDCVDDAVGVTVEVALSGVETTMTLTTSIVLVYVVGPDGPFETTTLSEVDVTSELEGVGACDCVILCAVSS
jgi:hypothetical protein